MNPPFQTVNYLSVTLISRDKVGTIHRKVVKENYTTQHEPSDYILFLSFSSFYVLRNFINFTSLHLTSFKN